MPDSDAPSLAGGCGCGAVRFTVSEPPVTAGYCHCTRCQHRTGGASSLQTRTVPGSFRITAGDDDLAVWRPGGGFEKAFCRLCGSALFSRSPDDASVVSVRFAAFDEDPQIRPTYRAFVDFAAPFEPIPADGLARYGGGRPERSSLAGTRWRAELAAPIADVEPPTIAFGEDWRLTGSTGVNQLFGTYELPGDVIVFGEISSTRIAGSAAAMLTERDLFAVLAGQQPVSVAGDVLEIGRGAEAFRFTRAG
jgi:heat shock protein HslJ